MISSPSRLADVDRTLVLDASVVINLLGTARPADIFPLFGRRIVVEEIAAAEVLRDPATGQPSQGVLDNLQSAEIIAVERMSGIAYEQFLELVGAESPDHLDDGEAATIAHAVDLRATAVIDDRKAQRVAAEKFPGLSMLWTMDLFASDALNPALTKDALAEVVFAALQNARMRVPFDYRSWVIDLIGRDRARLCPSIGRID